MFECRTRLSTLGGWGPGRSAAAVRHRTVPLMLAVLLVAPIGAQAQEGARADTVFLEAAKAIDVCDLYTLWLMLPDSYRNDIEELRAIVADVDPEVFNKAAGVLMKAIDVAIARKDDILKLAGGMAEMVPDDIADILKSLKEVLQKGGLMQHEQFKSLTMDLFFKDNGNTLMTLVRKVMMGRSPLEMLSGITAQLGEEQPDRAVVLVAMADGEVPIPFVKVEGKWVPEEVTLNWAEGIGRAKDELRNLVAVINRDKTSVMELLEQMEQSVELFEKAGDLMPLINLLSGERPSAVPKPDAATEGQPADKPANATESAPAVPH